MLVEKYGDGPEEEIKQPLDQYLLTSGRKDGMTKKLKIVLPWFSFV